MNLLAIWKDQILEELATGDYTIHKVNVMQRRGEITFVSMKITSPTIEFVSREANKPYMVEILERRGTNSFVIQFSEYTEGTALQLPLKRICRYRVSEMGTSFWTHDRIVDTDLDDIPKIENLILSAKIFQMMDLHSSEKKIHAIC